MVALHCIVLNCIVLYCIALKCTVLYFTALYCSILYRIAFSCPALQCNGIALCCVLRERMSIKKLDALSDSTVYIA